MATVLGAIREATLRSGAADIGKVKREFYEKLNISPSLMEKYLRHFEEMEFIEVDTVTNEVKAVGKEYHPEKAKK